MARLNAVGRFRAAVAGRIEPPMRIRVRKRDWSGAVQKPFARALAGHLRDFPRELTDTQVLQFFRRKFGWRGNSPKFVLQGSLIVKKGQTWRFDGEGRPGRTLPERDGRMEKLCLEAALQLLSESGEWAWPADIEDTLGGQHMVSEGWLAGALYRESKRAGSGVVRSGDGHYRVAAQGPRAAP